MLKPWKITGRNEGKERTVAKETRTKKGLKPRKKNVFVFGDGAAIKPRLQLFRSLHWTRWA